MGTLPVMQRSRHWANWRFKKRLYLRIGAAIIKERHCMLIIHREERERVEKLLGGPFVPAAPSGLPDRPYLTLTEAVTWIAFGVALDSASFHIADQHKIGPFSDRSKLIENVGSAMFRFSEKASGGLLQVRGKYVQNYIDHQAAECADTRQMDENALRDFAQFDSVHGGLERGQAAKWESIPLDRILHGRPDGWRDVEIGRAGLASQFPPGERWKPSDQELIDWCANWLKLNPGKGERFAWPEFRTVPAFFGLSRDDVFRPAFRMAKTSS